MRFLITTVIALLFIVSGGYATHNRAGEITYRHVDGNTYEFTVYTCTKTSAPADRPFLPIFWGDGSPSDSLERSQIIFDPVKDAQVNVYVKSHTFPGPGLYEICITDPNRNSDILNIANGGSVQIPFAIQTTLRISPAVSPNSSVYFNNSHLQDACLWQPWVFNPGAVDPDADSLVFSLVPGMGENCITFEQGFYEYPNEIPPSSSNPPNPSMDLSIDPQTGTIVWEVPQREGEYNIAILVEEYQNGLKVGTVLRDMQITVLACDNVPPVIEALRDTCVEAGQILNFSVFADDPNSTNVQVIGFGAPYEVANSPADPVTQSGQLPPVEATFNWNTNCSHVRLAAYPTIFQATDNGPGVDLVAIETMNIYVVAPAPENLLAEALGSAIQLTWDQSPCTEAIGYKIYRRIGSYGFEPGPCETGVPEYTGFVEIDNLPGLESTTYLDMDDIIFGRETCYMVVAYFADGAESYASNESCDQIKFEIPIIKKNSVGITSVSGVDSVLWRSPIELDTTVFPGPYQYRLLRTEGYDAPGTVVFTSEIEADIDDLPTSFISVDINTQDTAHTYRVELYSGGDFAAQSNKASSLFLELTPNDNQMGLNWREEVPWLNYEYEIYRQTDGTGPFDLIDVISEVGYIDSNLVNNRTYCYYIISRGSYQAVEENDTLVNFSQQICAQPYDRTPPCPPVLTGEGDCVAFTLDFEWTNPNDVCPETDDVTAYNIYFTPIQGGEFRLLETIEFSSQTELSLYFENSIAGCYAVTALDSVAPWPDGSLNQNESEFSNILCFDNCPEYEFPNIITPNGDGKNDVFGPFPYRSVESVEFTVFNRWGSIVFQSTDPDILWDGTNQETGELVSDGTYFYTCKVFSIRLSGLDPVNLSGYVTVLADKAQKQN